MHWGVSAMLALLASCQSYRPSEARRVVPRNLVARGWCDVGKVYIGVLSAARYRDKRDAIRASWMRDVVSNGDIVEFFVGVSDDNDDNLAILEEQKEHRDLVQSGSREGYFSITNKTIAILHAGAASNGGVTHVIKTDDDTFIRYHKVLRFLKSMCASPSTHYVVPDIPYFAPRNSVSRSRDRFQHFVMGNIELHMGPVRDQSDKFFLDVKYYKYSEFPTYPQGNFYVMDRGLADILSGVELYNQFPFEDVSFGGWIRDVPGTNALFVHNPLIVHTPGCDDTHMTDHHISPEDMVCLYTFRSEYCGCSRA